MRNLNNLPVELYVAEVGDKQLEPARKLGLPADRLTTNYKIFADKVDGVVVVTPAQTHFPLCREFLEAGKDVFVEKPLTTSVAEGKVLCKVIADTKQVLLTGSEQRGRHLGCFYLDRQRHWRSCREGGRKAEKRA